MKKLCIAPFEIIQNPIPRSRIACIQIIVSWTLIWVHKYKYYTNNKQYKQ